MTQTPRSPSDPRIEVLIGVHTPSRPVERAAASALSASARVRVTVVAHNTDPAGIYERLGSVAGDPRVRVLSLNDGIRSPAGPYNAGLDAATGDFVSIIGSDDEFSRGALDAWLALADSAHADVLVAPVVRSSGGIGTAPRPRPGHTVRLDGDRDRLFERVAPLGLVRRERFADLRLTEGLARGEDQVFSLHLWFSGASVAFDPTLPPYVEHDDQPDRITMAPAPFNDDVAFLDAIETDPVFQAMSPAARRALGARLIRVFVIGAIASRLGAHGLDDGTRDAIQDTVRRLSGWAPGVEGLLARRDRALVRVALRPDADVDALEAALASRSGFRSPSALIPADVLRLFHRHAPLRSLLAQRRIAKQENGRSRASGEFGSPS